MEEQLLIESELRALYLIVNTENRVVGVTFNVTDYRYGEVLEDTDLTELADFLELTTKNIVWNHENECLEEVEEVEEVVTIELLKEEIDKREEKLSEIELALTDMLELVMGGDM